MSKIAVAQYQIECLASWRDYTQKLEQLLQQAKEQGAELLLLPEYAGTEIAGYHATDDELYRSLQSMLDNYLTFCRQLSQKCDIYLQPGTILVDDGAGKYFNRAYFFSPNGNISFQDKLHLTEYEKTSQLIANGTTQKIFETSFGKIGIAICYDSEFPDVVRRLCFAGAELILVPSYTITEAGYYRVYLSARARALENQCYVAISYVVGNMAVTEPHEQTQGRAAVVGPVDVGFANNGIIVEATKNQVDMLTVDLSFKKLATVRKHGQVQNFNDAKSSLIDRVPLEVVSF